MGVSVHSLPSILPTATMGGEQNRAIFVPHSGQTPLVLAVRL